jgi:hypothetical protein
MFSHSAIEAMALKKRFEATAVARWRSRGPIADRVFQQENARSGISPIAMCIERLVFRELCRTMSTDLHRLLSSLAQLSNQGSTATPAI